MPRPARFGARLRTDFPNNPVVCAWPLILLRKKLRSRGSIGCISPEKKLPVTRRKRLLTEDFGKLVTGMKKHREITEMKCRNHPDVEATWRCLACGRSFCERCVKIFAAHGPSIATCPVCGEKCEDITQTEEAIVSREASFWDRLPAIFAYPLRKHGPHILVGGAIFFAIVDLAARLPVLKIICWLFFGGYLCRYFLSIVYDSATGSTSPPTWPEMDPSAFISDNVKALVRFIAPAVVSYLPAVAYFAFGPRAFDGAFVLLVVVGSIYYPMSLTAVAFFDRVSAVSPVPVIRSISRAPVDYLATCVVFMLVLFSLGYVREVNHVIHVFVLSLLVRWFIVLYLWTMAMHLLGMFYHTNRHKLHWT